MNRTTLMVNHKSAVTHGCNKSIFSINMFYGKMFDGEPTQFLS